MGGQTRMGGPAHRPARCLLLPPGDTGHAHRHIARTPPRPDCRVCSEPSQGNADGCQLSGTARAPKQQIQQMQATVAALPGFLHATLPVIFALGALVWSYTCYTVARHVLRRVGHQLPGFRPILEWRISPSIASVLLLASGTLALSSLISTHLSSLALDVLLADFFIFAFQGALVGVAWMNRHQVRG